MPEKKPHKNIDPVLVDIRNPQVNYRPRFMQKAVNLVHSPRKPVRKKGIAHVLFWSFSVLFGVVLLIAVIVVAVKFRSTKEAAWSGGQAIVQNFSATAEALKDLRPEEASRYLRENEYKIRSLKGLFDITPNTNVLDVLGRIVPQIEQAWNLLGQLASFNLNLIALTDAADTLERKGFGYFRSDGTALLNTLQKIQEAVSAIITNAQAIKSSTTGLKNFSGSFRAIDRSVGDYYLEHSSDLYATERFLSALVALFSTDAERHIALLFQNPSEIRPGGGFIGSYADITVKKGQMTAMDVRDIYDPEGQLDIKVIPPGPLRTLTTDWGARDANWFFDFPTSAKTVIGFLEASKIYSEKNVTFDAAIGVNINVLESILRVLGPIELPDYKLTITADNFLTEIQREVEAGKDKQKGEPKRILKILTPVILERLQKLSPETQRELFSAFQAHFGKKDVMVYAKDSALLQFFKAKNLDGAVYELPSEFWGNYLAVVDANIAGGKTDRYITQRTDARIDVDTSGNVFTDLTVTRTHNGNKEKDLWYRALNQNFIRVLTTPDSSLVGMKGNQLKKNISLFEYATTTYVRNADLEAMESTEAYLDAYKTWRMTEAGKTAFATWFNTKPGTTSTLEMRYETPAASQVAVGVGSIFTFVFERQSGVHDTLKVTIFAPFGYRWKETKSSFYAFESDNPPARLIEHLTLER
ncbi:MAG: DUF4012 domain-containing protein [Patescibacteria group bacterium]